MIINSTLEEHSLGETYWSDTMVLVYGFALLGAYNTTLRKIGEYHYNASSGTFFPSLVFYACYVMLMKCINNLIKKNLRI